MTLASTPPIITYAENGVTTAFAVPFQFIDTADLKVTRIDPTGGRAPATLGADYTVIGGTFATGTLTVTAAKPNGWQLEIKRVTPRTQPTDYTPGDTFPAETHEHALDREMMVSQEIEAEEQELERRAVRAPMGETLSELPLPAVRANKLLFFDGGGDVTTVAVSQLAKGDPGGNAMAIGLFIAAGALSIPVGTDMVMTSGYGAVGQGAARYINDAAVDVAYVTAHPRTSFRTVNARGFRLDPTQPIRIEMTGGVADAVETSGSGPVTSGTYNDPALNALLALPFLGTLGLFFPYDANSPYQRTIEFGLGGYRFQFPIDLKVSVTLQGMGTGLATHGNATNLYWPASTAGIYINSYWTSLGVYNATPTTSAEGSRIRGMRLVGGGGGLDLTKNGIRANCLFEIDGVVCENFPGSGLDTTANSGATDATKGNTNGSTVRSYVGKNNAGHTWALGGSDGNAIKAVGVQSRTAGLCGIYNTAVFNSEFWGLELDGFGDGATAAYVSHGGKNYIGVGANLGSTTPGTNNAIWYADGSEGGGLYPAWVNGGTYNISLPIYDSGGGSDYFGYQEGHYSHVLPPSRVHGQTMGATYFSNTQKLVVSGPALGICNQANGYGFYMSSNGTLPPSDPHGNEYYGGIFPDPLNNVLWTLRYAANGYAMKRMLDPVAHTIYQTVDGTNPVFGFTGMNSTQTFGRSAGVSGAFWANTLMAGDGSSNPNNARCLGFATAAPASGIHAKGDFYINSGATVGQPKGWQCSAAGNPGTFTSWGAL